MQISQQRILRISWQLIAFLAVVFLLTSLPGYYLRISDGAPGLGINTEYAGLQSVILQVINTFASLASAILSFYLAVVIYQRLFDNLATMVASFFLLFYSVVMTGPLEHWSYYWLGSYDYVLMIQGFLVATPLIALLFLFPDGRFVPSWTRWALLLSLPWNGIFFILPNPFLGGEGFNSLIWFFALWVFFPVLGVYAQVYRFRRVSSAEERQQSKWVLFGFVLWIGYMLVSSIPYFYLINLPPSTTTPWWAPISELSWWLSVNIIPVTLGIAFLRSHLWNVNFVINRTLVYGALTLITMTLYILIVGSLGSLLQLGDRSLVAFLTTGLVAVLFQPLRIRLQSWINRLMYGERDDPVSVLTKLGEHLENTGSPQDALHGITETVARTLKIPYVAIELGMEGQERKIVAESGLPKGELVRLPMAYQSEASGSLLIARRSLGEPFSDSELKLLGNIASQAGAAAHAVRLTEDLRKSRQELVTAREEERRRLRRDLHDGLGPTLASLTLKLDAAKNLLKSDQERVGSLLDELKSQTQDTIRDIRSLVYDLRPPAIDELGLVDAIQSTIDRHGLELPHLVLEVEEPLPDLPAAFEVAIYRIALEGITNMIRHSQAESGTIRILQVKQALIVELIDDGIGLDALHSKGIGLASMQERVEELGGDLKILPIKRGAHLQACLPLIDLNSLN